MRVARGAPARLLIGYMGPMYPSRGAKLSIVAASVVVFAEMKQLIAELDRNPPPDGAPDLPPPDKR
ncbi:hypothetical protein SR870_06620 [Rhodopseudomonas palustris]|uniref:hypothetical protein n=1 Tax=Rhodopseudomonas palustris TaxID=1076 RepID=UPI002ACD9440|nr:hypothetical protein [Rhodopseudomonas palustris]WQH00948.1 hypothetical protein SR870_06620 [Rhodopseudomonas palustris]